MSSPALLLGNGISRVGNDLSWTRLIEGLIEYAGVDVRWDPVHKPFPLFYEEIWLRAWRENGRPEADIKRRIRTLARKIQPNELHRSIAELPCDHLLTTNYDYALEKGLTGRKTDWKRTSLVREQRYSLFRRRSCGLQNVWHIHGEVDSPESILVGFEQYGGYLQHIRNYLLSGVSYKNLTLGAARDRLRLGDEAVHSWVDCFFLRDLYILGLTLDFTEMTLWWLLIFRIRLVARGELAPTNRIVFVHAQPTHRRKDAVLDNQHVLELLDVAGVEVVLLPRKDRAADGGYGRFYRDALDWISRDSVG
jgi:SIR2-like domain